MVSTFINPVRTLGTSPDESEPIQLLANASESEIELVIQAVYRQVLGNAHVMESERLTVPESRLKRGEISVREFVRQVALSPLYARLFAESCSRTRTIELNFKHLLGRAPSGYAELSLHGHIYDQGGFEAEIDSYLESDEYFNAFGNDTVPYSRGYTTTADQTVSAFNYWSRLRRGAASSDKGARLQQSQLNSFVMADRPSVLEPVTGLLPPPVVLPPSVATPARVGPSTIPPLSQTLATRQQQAIATRPSSAIDIDRSAQFYSAYESFKQSDPVELRSGFSPEDADVVIRAVYRQVLGNAYVMESERLTVPESQLKGGEISVREFVRQVAKSELYRSRFFENCYRYRAIELNFKHLLGRAPDNFDEMREHSAILDQGSFEDEIDSYLDSDEYQSAFGSQIVPYYRGTQSQLGQSMLGFTNLFELLRSASSSDKDLATNQHPRLTRALIQGVPYGNQKTVDATRLISEVLNLPTYQPAAPQSQSKPKPPQDVQDVLAKALNLPTYQPSNGPSSYGGDSSQKSQFYSAYTAFKETDPVELCVGFSEEDANVVIRAVYRQVLGNAYVMESERLTVPESQLKSGEISVREFVRQVAKSELYRSRFFENCYRYRAIELNFKHLLGRAPDNFDEMRYHSSVLDQGTFEDEIDAYLDSDEYQAAFGEQIVPYYRGTQSQLGQSMVGFSNLFQLLRGASSSDKDLLTNQKPRLTTTLIENSAVGVKTRDARDIIAEALNLATPMVVTSDRGPDVDQERYEAIAALQKTAQEQSETIERLEAQLTDLRSTAIVGASMLQGNYGSTVLSGDSGADANAATSLQEQVEQQAERIADLNRQIVEAQSLAAIGASRLNKWRSRVLA